MLEVKTEGAVAVLTMNRPQRRNALCTELVGRLAETIRALDDDAGVRAIVLQGASPGFCAGSDLKELATMDLRQMSEHEAITAAFARSIAMLSKPVIAAVEGFAMGGGFALATSCDIVVTSSACRWHLPEVQIGWIPPWGLEPLAARVGPVGARRLTWGAEPIDGTEAHRLGVADYLSSPGAAPGDAIALGERIAKLPQPAVASTKRYFAALVIGTGEARDAEANRLFREDCRHEVARATLARYGVKL